MPSARFSKVKSKAGFNFMNSPIIDSINIDAPLLELEKLQIFNSPLCTLSSREDQEQKSGSNSTRKEDHLNIDESSIIGKSVILPFIDNQRHNNDSLIRALNG
jgi:hypothetical protein